MPVRKTTLSFTVTTDGRKRADKVLMTFPMIYHRAFPPGAMVKRVRVLAHLVGSRLVYEAQFILEVANHALDLPGPRVPAGMDLGWRITDTGLRVATIMDIKGKVEQLERPATWMLRADYVEDLETALTNSLAPLLDSIRTEIEDFPVSPGLRNMLMAPRPAPSRVASLVLKHQRQGRAIPATLAGWLKVSRGMVEERAGLRRKLHAQRIDIYRNFVAMCTKNYHSIAIEDLNLGALARTQNGQDWIDFQRRSQRMRAAPSLLIRFLKEASATGKFELAKHDAANSTRACHLCGHLNHVKSNLRHTCEGCGANWDQDENASSNMLHKIAPRALISLKQGQKRP